jgi:uncharacterized protein
MQDLSAAPDLARIAQDLQLRKGRVEAIVALLDQGYSIPFLARFRKDLTGNLPEETLRELRHRLQQQRRLADRKQTLLKSLHAKGQLTEHLRQAILQAGSLHQLEDLYLPFKPKPPGPAAAARDKGLGPVAEAIWQADPVTANLAELLPTLADPDKGLDSPEAVREGVRQILAERIALEPGVRAALRRFVWDNGRVVCAPAPGLPAEQLAEVQRHLPQPEPVRQIPPHRVLALNRGAKQKHLLVRIECDLQAAQERAAAVLPLSAHPHAELLRDCLRLAVAELILPALEKEVLADLTERAEEHAIALFARNLRRVLMQPPQQASCVLAVYPVSRSLAAYAVLDGSGEVREHGSWLWSEPRAPRRDARHACPPQTAAPEEDRPAAPPEAAASEATACEAAPLPPPAPELSEPEGSAPEESAPAVSEPNPPPADEVQAVAASEAAAAPGEAQPPCSADPSEAGTGTAGEVAASAADGAAAGAAEAGAPAGPSPGPHSAAVIEGILARHPVAAVAFPQGGGNKRLEAVLAECLRRVRPELGLYCVNAVGIQRYATGSVGREEFPDLDAAARSAIALGRRLLDPLSEWVKVEPQHLGVGLYQHDGNEKRLREALAGVLESCVNEVGVDLNRASPFLLRYVAGLNPLTARAIVEYRQQHGPFRTREQLRQVPGISDLAYTQAAGFVRIEGGDQPLDATDIHPEHYAAATWLMEQLNYPRECLGRGTDDPEIAAKIAALNREEVCRQLHLGRFALDDIFQALLQPRKDPREKYPRLLQKRADLRFEDLRPGQELRGTVTNVVDFGAFVDIGLRESALVHISQLADRFVRHPHEVVAVGDSVRVWVLQTDAEKRRVSLTMIPPGVRAAAGRPKAASGSQAASAPGRPRQPQRRRHKQPQGQQEPAASTGQVSRPAEAPGSPSEQQQAPPAAAATGSQTASSQRPPRRGRPRDRTAKPLPQLPPEALKGEVPLRTFAELKAFMEAKKRR